LLHIGVTVKAWIQTWPYLFSPLTILYARFGCIVDDLPPVCTIFCCPKYLISDITVHILMLFVAFLILLFLTISFSKLSLYFLNVMDSMRLPSVSTFSITHLFWFSVQCLSCCFIHRLYWLVHILWKGITTTLKSSWLIANHAYFLTQLKLWGWFSKFPK